MLTAKHAPVHTPRRPRSVCREPTKIVAGARVHASTCGTAEYARMTARVHEVPRSMRDVSAKGRIVRMTVQYA